MPFRSNEARFDAPGSGSIDLEIADQEQKSQKPPSTTTEASGVHRIPQQDHGRVRNHLDTLMTAHSPDEADEEARASLDTGMYQEEARAGGDQEARVQEEARLQAHIDAARKELDQLRKQRQSGFFSRWTGESAQETVLAKRISEYEKRAL